MNENPTYVHEGMMPLSLYGSQSSLASSGDAARKGAKNMGVSVGHVLTCSFISRVVCHSTPTDLCYSRSSLQTLPLHRRRPW